jgi:putative phosphoesterase
LRLGVISDAHGNPLGLKACLKALARHRVDQVFFLGDAVGYLPQSGEVLQLLERFEATCLKGNHEAMILGQLPLDPAKDQIYKLTHAKKQLDRGLLERVRAWPESIEIEHSKTRIAMYHGSPMAPLTGRIYPDSDLGPLSDLDVDVVFLGHTHRVFAGRSGRVRVINPGSCGLPRGGETLASAVVYDSITHRHEFIMQPFAAEQILAKRHGEIHPSVINNLLGKRE